MAFIDAPEFDDAADKRSDGSHPRFFRESRPNPARTAADGVPPVPPSLITAETSLM